jgi:hypothetical protein
MFVIDNVSLKFWLSHEEVIRVPIMNTVSHIPTDTHSLIPQIFNVYLSHVRNQENNSDKSLPSKSL